jgi:hypothetical protein
LPDVSWLVRNYQGETAFCGEHAATHFQAILEHLNTPTVAQRYSPRYGAIKLKSPSSPVYDGYAIDAGTTMTAIFKWLKQVGADDYEPLENDVTLPLATYCDPTVITPAMDTDAANQKITTYAFDALTFADLQQAIYQNKAVILLIKCDDGFWGTSTPTFTQALYGHFIVAYGYDETGIWIIDSAEPNNEFALKHIATEYINPSFFFESGTAVDVPTSVQQVIQNSAIIPTQKTALISQIIADISEAVSLIQKEI